MKATEIMTKDPTTVATTDNVALAVDLLQSLHVRHLPVVDSRGTLAGILSDRDLGALMRTAFVEGAELERMAVQPADQLVADVMSTDPIAASEDADVAEVIDVMLSERVGAVPIVDDADRVVGIVSYVDVLEAFRSQEEEEEGTRGGGPRPRLRRRTPRGPGDARR